MRSLASADMGRKTVKQERESDQTFSINWSLQYI